MDELTLKELWQQAAEKSHLETKYKELQAQRETVAGRVKKLEKASRAEQADVDRLERGSLAAFFYQMIGRREEQLDKEREEACAARVRYDAAARELASIDADLERRRTRLAQLEGCEGRYREALAEKVRELKAGHGPAAQELMECETRMEGMRLQKQELKEAIDAGRVALHTAGQVLDSLDCADIPRLTVYNKCDKPGAAAFDPAVLLTSARTGLGLDRLLARLDQLLADRVRPIKVLLPYDALGLAAPLRDRGSVQAEEYRPDGLYLEAIAKREELHLFEPYML